MPFLRFSRDKRGYESIYLVHTSTRRGKPSRPRVLYWYRTPPGIRVGRPPFDDEVRRRLESLHPDVVFDWPTIIATPFPPPAENEQWRERRRAERAAKQAQRAEEESAARSDKEPTAERPAIHLDQSDSSDEAVPGAALIHAGSESETPLPVAEPQATSELDRPAETGLGSSESEAASRQAADRSDPSARRRRRRGGRRRRGRGPGEMANQELAPAGNAVVATDPERGSVESSSDSETTDSIESNEE